MSKKFSKKIENAMAEAMALTEPEKVALYSETSEDQHMGQGDFSQCDDKGCWFCYPQNAEMPVGTVNFDTAEPVNPFKVIADWIRGNLVQNSMESHPSYPRQSVSWADGETSADIPSFVLPSRQGGFVTGTAYGFAVDEDEELIPLGVFDLPNFITNEIIRQANAIEKMDSILRDAPVERPTYTLDDLTIIPREELARLRNIENAYDEIVNIVKE